MKNIIKIYKIIFRYWIYLLSGFISMILFAFFSSVSITMAIPLFDHVFKKSSEIIQYHNFTDFSQAFGKVFSDFISTEPQLFPIKLKIYQPLIINLEKVLDITDPMLLLWIIGFTLIILIAIKNLFFFTTKLIVTNLEGKTVRDLRNMVFHKYLYQSLAFFNENKIGDSLVRMVSDIQIIGNFFIISLLNGIQNIFLLFTYAFVAFILNPRLFIFSLLIFPVFSFIVGLIGKKIKKYSKRIQNQSSNMFSVVEEILNSMKIVKSFSKENFEYGNFKQINQKYFSFWRKAKMYSLLNIPLSEFNGTLTGIIVLLIGGKQLLDPASGFSLGDFTAFLLAIFSLQHPIKQLTQAYANIKKADVSLERVYEILDKDSEIKEDINPIEKKKFDDKIVLKSVSFSYSGIDNVLININLELKKGQKIALVGSSGSGKTTLVNLLTRMYDKTSGDILIDGIPIEKIIINDLRSLFGTVTQDSILFSETIRNNISYGSRNDIDISEIKNAAEIAFADEFIEKLPEKYDEMLQTKASNLSGGQKQRLCIARAIVGNPPILIFDEATSALDTESERKVQIAIEQATRNRTVIVIAHRLSTILSSDIIVVLDHGKIVGMGKHQDLLESCEKYKRLYDLQFMDNANVVPH